MALEMVAAAAGISMGKGCGEGQDYTLTTIIYAALVVLARAMKQEKELKGTQIGKEEVKGSMFEDHMILYTEKLK
jgi:hypothetical protein